MFPVLFIIAVALLAVFLLRKRGPIRRPATLPISAEEAEAQGHAVRRAIESNVPGLPESIEDCGHAVQELLRQKPRAWEHLLFAEALRDCFAKVNGYYAATDPATPLAANNAIQRPLGASEDPRSTLAEIAAMLDALSSFSKRVESAINEGLPGAIGPPGQPGDVVALLDVARGLAQCYAMLVAIIRHVRSMKTREYFAPIRHSIESSAERCREQLDAFPDRIRSSVAEAIHAAETGGTSSARLSLILEVDSLEMSQAMKIAMDGVRKEFGVRSREEFE
ncbi:MAG TPA: hypothetical protein VE326_10860 [Candidatus Binatia bacterium]|nr:hypothetical protein [Candidatus Binatia bacterium]